MKFYACLYEIFMHENMNYLSMKMTFPCMKKIIDPGIKSIALDIFMGNWAVHYTVHGILIHESFWANHSFLCLEISFSGMKISFSCRKNSFS